MATAIGWNSGVSTSAASTASMVVLESAPRQVRPDAFGRELLEALGIDPSKVTSFDLRCSAAAVPVLTVSLFVDLDDVDVLHSLERYTVVPVEAGSRRAVRRFRPATTQAERYARGLIVARGESIEITAGA